MEVEQIYGLIGYPLIHSFSKTFFNEKFSDGAMNEKLFLKNGLMLKSMTTFKAKHF